MTPWVFDVSGNTCGDIVSRIPNLSLMEWREECTRWLDVPTPGQVEGAYMEECYEEGDNIHYRYSVCCEGNKMFA